jgi:Protein of unknown function (DUF2844)
MTRRLVGIGKNLARVGTIVASIVLAPGIAHATLGGDVVSVHKNQMAIGGELRLERCAYGERHVMQLANGTVVRQYLSPSGMVYAVTWRGPRTPNLRELLGTYFAQLSRLDRARGGRHAMTLTGDDFLMRSIGRRDLFAGGAWVPSLLPSGVDPQTLLTATSAP